ncbi:MAG: hypothetical protein JO148_11305, partial [Acidimicrobiia bacterium]|nr:hypothetical protein [Acidimicrobiia bacterium]
MAVRLEIELTSSRDDGTWTWRAAGARQPKGVLESGVLPAGSKVGDILRVEAEQNIDGINVTTVLPPKTKSREPERLEMIAKPEGPLVSASVTGRADRGDRGERRGRGEGRRPPRGDRPQRRERERDRPSRPGGREGAPRRGTSDRPAAATEERPSRPRPKRLHAGRAHRDAL